MTVNAVFYVKEDLVVASVETARQEIKALVVESIGDFTIDFAGVEMIDSKGIGLIIHTYNTLTKSQRKLRIIEAKEDIVQLFRTMRLDKHFSID